MVGAIVTRSGVRVTARRRVESELAGSDNCCVDCGAELTREEIRWVYHLKTAPQCSCCGGYGVEEAYPTPAMVQADEAFRAWRIEERALELLH